MSDVCPAHRLLKPALALAQLGRLAMDEAAKKASFSEGRLQKSVGRTDKVCVQLSTAQCHA